MADFAMSSIHDGPVTKLGKRHRLLNRMSRISSSPQLVKLNSDKYAPRHSVSCISLVGASNGSKNDRDRPVRIIETEIIQSQTTLPSSTIITRPTTPIYEKKSIDIISLLPGELRLQILSYLEPKELVRCSSVNKLWKRLCFDGQLWAVLDTTSFYQQIPVEQLTKIIVGSGAFIKHLNLRGCIQLQGDFQFVSKACQNLIGASFEGCRLERPTVHRLVTANTQLVHLNLSGLSAVTNSTCKHIAESCINLETLDVSYCGGMDARGIKKVINGCRYLNDLRAAECRGFNDPLTLEAIFKANTLKQLHLSGCDSLTNESIRILMEGIEAELDPITSRTTAPPRKLRHLDLKRCSELTDVALTTMAGNVPYLEGLELGHVTNLTDAGFATLLPTLPKLTHLDLEECSALTNEMLLELAKAPCAKQLQVLQLSFCENLSDEGLIAVVKNCTALKNLELDNTRVGDQFLREVPAAVQQRSDAISSSTPQISLRIVVFDCVNVNWAGVLAILDSNCSSATNTRTPTTPSSPPSPSPSLSTSPSQIIQLKCYYGWQQTVDEHTKRVLRGDIAHARIIGRKWAEYMIANEEANSGTRQRRRRAREAALFDDEVAAGRRSRRSGGCVVM